MTSNHTFRLPWFTLTDEENGPSYPDLIEGCNKIGIPECERETVSMRDSIDGSYLLPPIVASPFLEKGIKEEVTRVLLSMHQEPEGRRILERLEFDCFIKAPQEWFEKLARIEQMIAIVGEQGRAIEEP